MQSCIINKWSFEPDRTSGAEERLDLFLKHAGPSPRGNFIKPFLMEKSRVDSIGLQPKSHRNQMINQIGNIARFLKQVRKQSVRNVVHLNVVHI